MFRLKEKLFARNGSGTMEYTPTSAAPAVSGTLIESADFNTTMTEVKDALTQSVSKDGQTVITGDIDFDGNQLILDVDGDTSITADTDDQIDFRMAGVDSIVMKSGALNENKGADIASATTTDIGAATGNFVDVTGTTTITGLGTVQAGTYRKCRFTGALTLTYNATSLILPTGGNYTTVANDVLEFYSLGSGNWICTDIMPRHGTWSPTIQDSTGSDAEGQTYSVQAGNYTKIGNRVFITANLQITSLGTLSTGDQARIAGLPFTSSSVSNTFGSGGFSIADNLSVTAGSSPTMLITTNRNYFSLYEFDSTSGSTVLSISNISATTQLVFHGQYLT